VPVLSEQHPVQLPGTVPSVNVLKLSVDLNICPPVGAAITLLPSAEHDIPRQYRCHALGDHVISYLL